MAKRLNREPVDDMLDELVRAVRTWGKAPKPEATAQMHRMIDQYRRAWLGEDEPEPRQAPQLRPVEAA